MTDPDRLVLTRVGLRIPGWIGSESTSPEPFSSEPSSTEPSSSEPSSSEPSSSEPSSTDRDRTGLRPDGDEHRTGHSQRFDRLSDIATTAERSGFDSLWVTDNVGEGLGPSGRASGFEPYTVLGALATRTQTIALGAMVSPITARNPAVLAKIVTGVDVLSGGRAVLGVGVGVSGGTISGKASATPHDMPGNTQRPDRVSRLNSLAEGLRICRAMFTEEAPTFEGTYYRIEDAHNRPRPVRGSGIPILVGGRDDGGEDEGLLELVARYADAVTVVGGAETVRIRLNTLDRLCDDVGRDPAAISRIGVGRLVISPTEKEARQRLDRVAGDQGWDAEDGALTITGSPASVADQVGDLLQMGIDGVAFTLADAWDLELVEMAGTSLRSLFG